MQSIIIADSHSLFREALCSYLQQAGENYNISGVADYESLLGVLKAADHDLVLIDMDLTGWQKNAPDEPLSAFDNVKLGLIIPLLQAEADWKGAVSGVFPKALPCKAFAGGIREILDGRTFFPSLKDNAAALEQVGSPRKTLQDFHLTIREKEVLSHLVKGASNKDIARALDLQVVTVKLHVRGICRKMKAANRTQAALMAKESGWA